jgi:AcrR family transcriptional regulator
VRGALPSPAGGEMPSRVITGADAVRAGRRMFADRATLDMDDLAEQLSVSRATLYRVVSSRDRLLGDVLWSFAGPLYERAVAETAGTGTERVLEVLRRFGTAIMANRQFRAFLAGDPQSAMRVLFGPEGGVHERFVAANRELLLSTAERDGLSLPFGVDPLAYVFSRIFESIWYADLLSGREIDLGVAERVARAVLLVETAGGAG